MFAERQQLEGTIAGLEAHRALLGDTLVDTALAALRVELAMLAEALPLETPSQTLKQVTILFLDIVGSTALSQHLDPEATSAVVDGALAQFTAIVAQQQGKVLQYAGDNLLAVFGADEAREDDAERAVRAGLALLDEGRNRGEQVRQHYGYEGFNVRVGVHTGGVLLGGGVDAEGSIRGEAVNIAARMEQTAPPGALRISHDTYRQVRGVFAVEAQPPLAVKGVNEPVATYLVLRARPRAFHVVSRGVEGVETRMVGRDAELKALCAAFERLFSKRSLVAVTIVGEAGVGKSRLMYEFERWAETRPEAFHLVQGRAYPQTQGQPYGLLRDVLAGHLRIDDGDTLNVGKEKFERGIAPLFAIDMGTDGAQTQAHLLGHLIGLDFSASPHLRGILEDHGQIRNRACNAAAQVFRRLGADRPVVLQIEDLHWADDASLDFLGSFAQDNRDVPMLMIATTRPTLFERRPDWADADGTHGRIDLALLDRTASRELASEVLRKLGEIPDALRELVIGGAEGNPFYMEELVKMLIDQGAIETGADRWTLDPDKLLAARVPTTLTGILQARLDGLPPAERRALQQASVIGQVFWDRALSFIDPGSAALLPSLVRRDLIVASHDVQLDGANEFTFKHHILQQVTYETLLKRERCELHARVAAWLAGLGGARSGDFLGATAVHFEDAGDSAHACEYFVRAAAQARMRFAHDAVLGYSGRALALIDVLTPQDQLATRWRVYDLRERTLNLMGRRAEQRADLDAMRDLADAVGNDGWRAEAAERRGYFALRTGDYTAQEACAREAMLLAKRVGNVELELRACQLLAAAVAALGDPAGAKSLAEQGLARVQSLGFRRGEGWFLNILSFIASRQDDALGIVNANERDLLVRRELGDSQGEAIALSNLGVGWLGVGQCELARTHLEDGLRMHRAQGNRPSQTHPLCGLSQLALWRGDGIAAVEYAQQALEIAVAVQLRDQEAHALCCLGDAELSLGRHDAAAAAFDNACTVAKSIMQPARYDAAAGRARVELDRGQVAEALRHLEPLLGSLLDPDALESTQDRRAIRLTGYRVLAAAGDARAREVLQVAHAELQARAARIAVPALRESFLDAIPHHREIVALWAAHQAMDAGQVRESGVVSTPPPHRGAHTSATSSARRSGNTR